MIVAIRSSGEGYFRFLPREEPPGLRPTPPDIPAFSDSSADPQRSPHSPGTSRDHPAECGNSKHFSLRLIRRPHPAHMQRKMLIIISLTYQVENTQPTVGPSRSSASFVSGGRSYKEAGEPKKSLPRATSTSCNRPVFRSPSAARGNYTETAAAQTRSRAPSRKASSHHQVLKNISRLSLQIHKGRNGERALRMALKNLRYTKEIPTYSLISIRMRCRSRTLTFSRSSYSALGVHLKIPKHPQLARDRSRNVRATCASIIRYCLKAETDSPSARQTLSFP